MVGIPAGYDCPPALVISGGDFLCLGLTFCRGFVIMVFESNQILLLCMLRFNPFPRVVFMFLTIVRRDFATV